MSAAPPADPTEFDLIVVGAGLAGSTVAAAVADAGHRVLLLERTHFPRHKVCGEFLSPEVQATLCTLNLYDAVAVCGPQPLTHARIVSRTGRTLHTPLPGVAWGLSRYALDAALAQAAVARGVTLYTGARVREYVFLDAARTDVRVTYLRQGREHTAQGRAVIMAVGRGSAKGLPPWPETTAQSGEHDATQRAYVGVKVHMRNVHMPREVALFLFDGGYVGVNPVENGAANVCLLATYAAFDRGGRDPVTMVQRLAQEQPEFGALLAGATLVDGSACVVAGVDTHRPLRPWQDVLCLGDTATMIPPLCGDGMAMALRSAELAAPLTDAYLTGALSEAAWRDAYTAQWHAEFAGRLRTGRLLERVLMQPRLNEWALALGRALPPLAAQVVRLTRGGVPAGDSRSGT